MNEIIFKTPTNQKEFKEYDLFRWKILRKPIGSKSHEIAASVLENHADMRENVSMNVLMENDRLRARIEELEAELTLCKRARRLLRGKK